MSNVLVSRLAVAFGAPLHSVDPVAYMGEMVRLTKSYGETVLNKAADLLIREHRPTQTKPWPSPNEICTACADAAEMVQPSKRGELSHPDWTPKAVAKAYELLRSPMGRRAGDEGWNLALWNFCRKNGRLPNDAEIRTCKTIAVEFDETYAVCLRGLGGACNQALTELGASIHRKRELLARHSHGEDVPRDALTQTSKRMVGERD